MPLNTSIPGPSKKVGRTLLSGVGVVLFAGMVCAVGARAQDTQDAAEAARAEQARKAATAKTPRHVYTEDDLKRAQILTTEDQARVAARKKNPSEKKEEQAKSGGESAPGEESLGEVARRYREEKEQREAARLLEQGTRSQFPMKLPEATLAMPKPVVAPPKMEARPLDSLRRGMRAGRVSPFEPRPLRATPREPVAPRRAETVVVPRGEEARVAAKPKMAGVPSAPKSLSTPKVGATIVPPRMSTPVTGMVTRRVERGDSWWKLAENYLGSGARWKELRGMNSAGTDARAPEFLLLGSTVMVPATVAMHPKVVGKIVTVKKGDTLWSMARAHLGRGTAWKCLAEANPELGEPEGLQIGMQVRLPEGDGCGGEAVKSRK